MLWAGPNHGTVPCVCSMQALTVRQGAAVQHTEVEVEAEHEVPQQLILADTWTRVVGGDGTCA